MRDWFVLRTDGRHTLSIASSLTASGYEVWTPRFIQFTRRPRTRTRTQRTLPLTPTYIFARTHHLPEMIELANEEDSGFSVMLHAGSIPMLNDDELEPLRTAETAVIPKRQQPSFDRGDIVNAPHGIFGGMAGRVEKSRAGKTVVMFGRVPVEFQTCQLRQNRASEALAA